MKTIRKIMAATHTNDDAIAGIVVAVMIVGLILAIVSIVQTVYIPKWMQSREAEHMGVVGDQLSELKYAIDAQSTIRQTLPISTSITLGSKELGFLTSSKAFGRLTIEENATALYCKLYNGTEFQNQFGILKYSSENSYFLDQTYIYEIGALILDQTQGSVLTIKPSLKASYNYSAPPTVLLNITCVNLIPVGGKTSISGYGTYPIRTEYLYSTNKISNQVTILKMTTQYPTIWYRFLNDTFSGVGLKEGNIASASNVQYNITQVGNQITVTFNDPGQYLANVKLNYRIITILVQIAPGWVE